MYGLGLVGSLLFYWAYREWLSWLVLAAVITLPWFSLVCSLPAMAKTTVAAVCPSETAMGGEALGTLRYSCPLPMPPVRGKLRIEDPLSGVKKDRKAGEALPTRHCARLVLTPRRVRVYDYLGLFSWKLKNGAPAVMLVCPEAEKTEPLPELERYRQSGWRPKPGGGFSENHELRLYRPGDSLKLVHWKLTAKTGKTVVREPMEALRGKAVLALCLSGSRGSIDERLGKLLWLSDHLLELELPHEIRCAAAGGTLCLKVSDPQSQRAALERILSQPMAKEATLPDTEDAAWCYLLGGEDCES